MTDSSTQGIQVVLVTGATGTVGSEVVRQLAAAGQQPRALVRNLEAARQRLGDQADLAAGDLDQPETLYRALDGAGRVFLLTIPGERQLAQERAVIEAARRAGVHQVVRLSRAGADERSPLHVARFHGQAERQLQSSGLAATILRPPMFMQNLLFMVRGGAIASAIGDGKVAMVDARDVAAAAVAALTTGGHAGKTYVVTGPRAVSLADAAGLLSRQLGRVIRCERLAPSDVRDGFLAMGADPWLADDAATLDSLLASGHDEPVADDIRNLTGRPPRTLEAFVRDYAVAFDASGCGE
jgi:uncharacterized protein YbjT (DUF2867 family)